MLLAAAAYHVVLDLGPGERLTGFFRPDLIYYSANARQIFETGNGILYSDPYSASFSSPVIYSHLQLVLHAWVWRVTGISLPVVWQAAQIVFGALMFVALYRLVECFTARGGVRTLTYLVAAIGGGGAVLEALARWLGSSGTSGLLWSYTLVTGSPRGGAWLPNVFQNALLSTEAFYHALAFATFAAVLKRRFGWAALGIFLLWWSHPFTGLEVALIVGAFGLCEGILRKDRKSLGLALGTAILSALFLFYYLFLLPNVSPESAEILRRWRGAAFLFRVTDAFSMWGVFLLWPAFLFFERFRLLALRTSAADRFLAIWLVIVAALIVHDWFTPAGMRPFQPLHFSHGYLFLPMAILMVRGLALATDRWPRPRLRAAAAVFLAFVALDNVFFTAATFASPEPRILSADATDILDRLQANTEPGLVLIGDGIPLLREIIPVLTPHRVYIFNRWQTPWFEEKTAVARRIVSSPNPAQNLAQQGIRWVIGTREFVPIFRKDIRRREARVAFRGDQLGLVEILVPITPQPPAPPSPEP